jgi:hypothetical protein
MALRDIMAPWPEKAWPIRDCWVWHPSQAKPIQGCFSNPRVAQRRGTMVHLDDGGAQVPRWVFFREAKKCHSSGKSADDPKFFSRYLMTGRADRVVHWGMREYNC